MLKALAVLALSAAFTARIRLDGSVRHALGNPSQLFQTLDTNGDGLLTASEIPKEHRSAFQQLLEAGDENKDGALSRSEFDAVARKVNAAASSPERRSAGMSAGAGRATEQLPGARSGSKTSGANVSGKAGVRVLGGMKPGNFVGNNQPSQVGVVGSSGVPEVINPTSNESWTPTRRSARKSPARGVQNKVNEPTTPDASETKMIGASASAGRATEQLPGARNGSPTSGGNVSGTGGVHVRGGMKAGNYVGGDQPSQIHVATPAAPSEEPFITPDATPTSFRKLGGKYLLQVLKRADVNGDGKLSADEAPPFLQKKFSQIDANHDGFLDAAELEAWSRVASPVSARP